MCFLCCYANHLSFLNICAAVLGYMEVAINLHGIELTVSELTLVRGHSILDVRQDVVQTYTNSPHKFTVFQNNILSC